MKWLLNLLWLTLLVALSPVIAWRMVRHGRYRRGWPQKLFGRLPKMEGAKRVVWFHAVSVGEVLLLQKIVESFRGVAGDAFDIVITTSTDTGFELAQNRFPDCTVTWFPLDFTWAVKTAVRRVNPFLVVLVELELWPSFLATCHQSGVRTALVNARMSEKSFRGYSRLRHFVRPLFANLTAVAAQSEEYADRIRQLGVVPERLCVTGSVKFDGVTTDRNNADTSQLRQLFRITPGQRVFIAGSTQAPEEAVALQAWSELLADIPDARLILVPRHRERFDDVAELVRGSGFKLSLRSQLSHDCPADPDSVIVLDTIGELSACWGLADVAFVGGSFGTRGGQNMLEPAAYGAAVMFGPNTWNFRDIVNRLLTARGAVVLEGPEEMAGQLRRLIMDESHRQQLGAAARSFVLAQRGALQKTTDVVLQLCARDEKPGLLTDRAA